MSSAQQSPTHTAITFVTSLSTSSDRRPARVVLSSSALEIHISRNSASPVIQTASSILRARLHAARANGYRRAP